MVLHVLRLTTLLLLGADTAYNQANLAHERELSCKELGLTDTLLGNGQYGQTLLVRSCSYPLELLGPKHAPSLHAICSSHLLVQRK